MAATIARINRERPYQPEIHRLGHQLADVEANTWRTFTRAVVLKDGSGYIEVSRGEERYTIRFAPEDNEIGLEVELAGSFFNEE